MAQGKIIHHEINSQFTVDVYLPQNYSSKYSYKTIYFNDGEMLFKPVGGMRLNLLLDSLIKKNVLEPCIAVGIYTNGNRLSLYTPYNDDWIKKNWGRYTPASNPYTLGIINDLIPFIENEYAVDKKTAGRAIAGFSLGGLYATWAAIKFPEVFGFSIAMSPSYWVADKALFKELNKKTAGNRFWFDMGTGEWEYYVPFYKQLQDAGYTPGLECFYYEVKDAKHLVNEWADRIQFPLIAFAGVNKDYTAVQMEVVAACMQSVNNPGTVYRRLNAVVTLANGIRYSLSNTASYKLLKGDIKLFDDGTIIAGTEIDAEVEVSYKAFHQQVKIKLANCELTVDNKHP